MGVDPTDFALSNVGQGPDPLKLSQLTQKEDVDSIVLLLQRDYYCGNCRRQVQRISDRYDEFESENAEVVSILPERADRARKWQQRYDLPYPLLADPDKRVSDSYGQPTRFGFLGNLHDLIGRMPGVIVFDTSDNDLEVEYTHMGRSPSDRPSVDELLEIIED